MTPQEQDMISGLIDRVEKTQLAEKDMDAEQMLQQGLGRNPDALYIMAQTVLVQKYALEQAQTQLTQAKAQIDQMQQHPEPRHATSFLGSLLGRNDAPAPPPPPPQGYPPQPVQAYPQYVPVGGPQYGAPMGMIGERVAGTTPRRLSGRRAIARIGTSAAKTIVILSMVRAVMVDRI